MAIGDPFPGTKRRRNGPAQPATDYEVKWKSGELRIEPGSNWAELIELR